MEEKEETLGDLFKQVTHPQNLGTASLFVRGLGSGVKAAHTGRLSRMVRNLNNAPSKFNTVGEAMEYGFNITQQGYDEGLKDTSMVQGTLKPFGKMGENIQANIAKRTKEGVCQDAACVVDQAIREKRPDLESEVIGGQIMDQVAEVDPKELKKGEKPEEPKFGPHAANLFGNKDIGYYYSDSTRRINNKKIEGATTLKEARRILEQGIGDLKKDGFIFKSDKKPK